MLAAVLAGLSLMAPAACPSRDARMMLLTAGQGMNGRVVEIHEDRLVIVAESRFEPVTIAFGERVTVYGRRLPATLQGRIGIAVRRVDGRWEATRCDVIPGARMALAIHGNRPCPKPGVRIGAVRLSGRAASVRIDLRGDVTDLILRWGGESRRRVLASGMTMLTEQIEFDRAGRHRVRVEVRGGAGPGCGTDRRSSATARRTVTAA